MIVSKSDNQNFDTVIFASRNIEEAAIPSDLLFIEISPDNNNFKFADFEEKLIMEKVTKTKKNLIFLLLYVVTINVIKRLFNSILFFINSIQISNNSVEIALFKIVFKLQIDKMRLVIQI